jgi:hypothetical protein
MKIGWSRQVAAGRDKAVVEAVHELGFLTSGQVARLFFHGIKHGDRKARDRLQTLYGRGLVDRRRLRGNEFVYFMEYSSRWEHWLMGNEFYVCLQEGLRRSNYYKTVHLKREFAVGNIIVDWFLVVVNLLSGTSYKWFIEIDKDLDLKRPQGKIDALQGIYENDGWERGWWADLNKEGVARFCRILFVTTDETRAGKLREYAKGKPLVIRVYTLEEVGRDIWASLF